MASRGPVVAEVVRSGQILQVFSEFASGGCFPPCLIVGRGMLRNTVKPLGSAFHTQKLLS